MTDGLEELLDPEDEQEIALEPLPAFMEERDYVKIVSGLPTPTAAQIEDFVTFVAGAKSWYKHLPARPPGSPMHFYLDPNAGRDRLRRWGHRVIYRDRTEVTEEFHYTWMPTQEYRRRFGYLAFCCPDVTRLFMTVRLADGMAKLDPNVFAPYIEIESGRLALVPEEVLMIGERMVTRTVHERTKAEFLWKKWNSSGGDHSGEPLSEHWVRIDEMCKELGREGTVRRVKALESELDGLIKKQREQDRSDMKEVIGNMLEFVQRSVNANSR